jgi:hypothetical protein
MSSQFDKDQLNESVQFVIERHKPLLDSNGDSFWQEMYGWSYDTLAEAQQNYTDKIKSGWNDYPLRIVKIHRVVCVM